MRNTEPMRILRKINAPIYPIVRNEDHNVHYGTTVASSSATRGERGPVGLASGVVCACAPTCDLLRDGPGLPRRHAAIPHAHGPLLAVQIRHTPCALPRPRYAPRDMLHTHKAHVGMQVSDTVHPYSRVWFNR